MKVVGEAHEAYLESIPKTLALPAQNEQPSGIVRLLQDLCYISDFADENMSSYSSYMEASSAKDSETKVAPKPTRMVPYTIEEAPPFNKANWKLIAKASQEQSIISPKLTMDEKLMCLCRHL